MIFCINTKLLSICTKSEIQSQALGLYPAWEVFFYYTFSGYLETEIVHYLSIPTFTPLGSAFGPNKQAKATWLT